MDGENFISEIVGVKSLGSGSADLAEMPGLVSLERCFLFFQEGIHIKLNSTPNVLNPSSKFSNFLLSQWSLFLSFWLLGDESLSHDENASPNHAVRELLGQPQCHPLTHSKTLCSFQRESSEHVEQYLAAIDSSWVSLLASYIPCLAHPEHGRQHPRFPEQCESKSPRGLPQLRGALQHAPLGFEFRKTSPSTGFDCFHIQWSRKPLTSIFHAAAKLFKLRFTKWSVFNRLHHFINDLLNALSLFFKRSQSRVNDISHVSISPNGHLCINPFELVFCEFHTPRVSRFKPEGQRLSYQGRTT